MMLFRVGLMYHSFCKFLDLNKNGESEVSLYGDQTK
ncbi:hypothetical protein BECAL_03040, partial [Bellilinea caldifistulae]